MPHSFRLTAHSNGAAHRRPLQPVIGSVNSRSDYRQALRHDRLMLIHTWLPADCCPGNLSQRRRRSSRKRRFYEGYCALNALGLAI
jgi:hypothetical protein